MRSLIHQQKRLKRLAVSNCIKKTESRKDGKQNIDRVTESGVIRSKRKIKLTPKALQNAIEDRRTEILKSRRRLLIIMQSKVG